MTPRPFRTLLIAIALISLIVSVPGAIFAHSARLSKGVAAQSIVQPEANQPNPPTDFKAGEVLVRFKPHVSPFGMLVTRLAFNATRIRSLYDSPVELWRVPEGQEQQVVDRLRADPSVEYAELNYVYHAFIIPNDPSYGQQWAHAKIQSPAAWDIVTGTTGITIAIIDTGIDEAHPDLTGKIVPGYDFVDSDINPHDLNGHGTHVAGIAAAASNNGVGVAGMNWLAKIMPIRVLDAQGSGYSSNITDGIAWAYQHGAKVINLSLGGPSYSQAMQDAVNAAHAAGSLIVAAMGNCRTTGSSCPNANPTEYPAALSNVMAVAATNPSDTYTYFSQYGAHCDIAAPGGEMRFLHDPDGIYSTMPTYDVYLTTHYPYFSKNYDFLQGTSQATPYVSGLASLVWAVNPAQTPDEIQHIIEQTAVDLGGPGWDQNYGWGRINALAAVQLATIPPRVTDLHLANVITDSTLLTATLQWTAPSRAVTITLGSFNNLIDNANWSSATIMTDTLPVSINTYTAVAPNGGSAIFFALRSQNADGNWSDVSNNVFWPHRDTYLPLTIKSY